MTGKEMLDWLRGKPKITPEEKAKQAARQAAIVRYNADSKKHAQLLTALINVPAPILQNYLNDPNYVWDPVLPPTPPKPNKPRPI